MSDISIPGVSSNSGINTDKMIKDLMEYERRPLERQKNTLDEYQKQKKIWQDMRQSLSTFQDTTKALYGFRNPFDERVVKSSNSEVLEASADRGASQLSRNIQVEQVAKADKFMSANLNNDFTVPEGTYEFSVGEESIKFNFDGGSLDDFSKTLNNRNEEVLTSSVIKNTSSSNVLVITSQKKGAQNQLQFKQDAKDFALSAGILERTRSSEQQIALSNSSIQSFKGNLSDQKYSLENGTLTIGPASNLKINVLPPVSQTRKGYTLEMNVKVTQLQEPEKETAPPSGPDIPKAGSITYQGLTIENESSQVDLPEWKPPEYPPKIKNMSVLSVQGSNKTVNLPDIQDKEGTQTIQVPLSQLNLSKIESIQLDNKNTYKEISISDIRVFDKNARDGLVPQNALSTAQDASLKMDGVQVTRSSNTIDDLIPRVSLNLKSENSSPVELEVEPDTKTIKDSIINFVGYYNQLLTDIHVLTRNNESVIDDLKYMEEDDRKEAMERLGKLQGDITLNQIKNRLQNMMMNSYDTRANQELALLAQMGISTNASGSGGSDVESMRLRGYLELKEDDLDKALENNLNAIKDLFGYDSDGDSIIDTGLAYQVNEYINPYVQSGGIIASKIQGMETRISNTQDDIEDYKDHLENYEKRIKRDYAEMESALQEMQENSKALDRLPNSGK